MTIPTEPIGSIPRPRALILAAEAFSAGRLSADTLRAIRERAVADTIGCLEATESPVITDGEQAKPSFATYPIDGLEHVAPDGVTVTFADGHTRQLPRLTGGPFRYRTYAASYLTAARKYAHVPVKQAVISASALSLLYPEQGIDGYPREQFLEDLVREARADIRHCLEAGAHCVQIDFTEGRLALKLDPSRRLLRAFVDLNSRVLEAFSSEERRRIGIHTCPGGDRDSTHSADVDYVELLRDLFRLEVGNVYVQLASERDRRRVLRIIGAHAGRDQRVFVGVIDPLDPRVETAEEVRDRILEATEFIAPDRLGTTDDCGFAPFADDVSTSRDVAFAKIRARVAGTVLAARVLGF
jgi:5-methyltetrahydropteroyltriglutamate--homocysteine methyltransferase